MASAAALVPPTVKSLVEDGVLTPIGTLEDGEPLMAEPSVPVTPSPVTIATHIACVQDIEHLDSLMIEDFDERIQNLKFEQAGDRPTESELGIDVNRFLDAIR